jgi:choline dehydrogenase-like flavoprotein
LFDPHKRGIPGRERMSHYKPDDPVDMLIVGAGAGGATLAQHLARSGWKILILEAGPFWDPDTDWVSDEAGAHELYWTEPRVIGGHDPVELGKNNCGRGVGGSMIHYAGYTPLSPLGLQARKPRGRGSRLADLLPRPQAPLRAPGARVASRRGVVAVGGPARLSACSAPGRRGRTARLGRRPSPRHPDAPVARLDYTQCDNDRANIAYAKSKLHEILDAAEAQDVLTIDRYAHLVGGCPMSHTPETGVIDSDHRAWGVPNLFVADGSAMPTQGSANPALTIMALASRLAERLGEKRIDPAASKARSYI